ncbi:hypothetical protein LJC59_00900 [Desulfovibrio sp. OttesenSCG-928-A18]|nr:hypothetical protein [Desulfovibrio sp. OttesenSCG-928-A18]
MRTQIEQIKAAQYAYIMPLSDTRFTIYLQFVNQGNDLLSILWPVVEVSELKPGEQKKAATLRHQVFSRRDKYPAFHFHLTGYGYSKTYELELMLKEINPEITVNKIAGWAPGSTSW